MIYYHVLQDFINSYPTCAVCGEPLISYIRSDDISPTSNKLKYFRNINVKLTDNFFVFKIDHITQCKELHDQLSINIENNHLSYKESTQQDIIEVFNTLSLRLENVCMCDKYSVMSDYLIADPTFGCSILPVKLDVEIVVINDSLTAITYPYTQRTFVYNSENEKAAPFSMPRVFFNPQDKEKQFNRIQTIINFS